jgi:hypothetical protein
MALQDDLIIIKDKVATPSPYALLIKEFKDLKIEELGYVYFMCDHRSAYAVYEWDKRHEEVMQSLKLKTVSKKVEIACDKYNELIETSAVKLLKAARESVKKLEAYFRTVDLTLVDDNGRPIFHAKDLVNNLEKMGKVVDGLSRLEDIVKKEEQANNPTRGGVEVNKYSQ